MIIMIFVGIIIGMLYQAFLLYLLVIIDDEDTEMIIIFVEICSILSFMLLALKGYVS